MPDLGGYPGRGLVHLCDGNGVDHWIYFLTGRSAASRARRVRLDGDRVLVEPTVGDAADPLRHYACVRMVDDTLIVGNGDHVDVLAAGLGEGHPLDAVTATLEPEPDPPIHTPRIAMVFGARPHAVAARDRGGTTDVRIDPLDRTHGTATMLTTYERDVDRPSGSAPLTVWDERRDPGQLAAHIWASLDRERRIAVVAGITSSAAPHLSFSAD